MPKGVARDWPTDEELLALIARAGSVNAAARTMGVPEPSLSGRLGRRGLRDRIAGTPTPLPPVPDDPLGDLAARARELLKRKRSLDVENLADTLDVSPRRAREALDRLRTDGYRVPPERDGGHIELQNVAPDKLNLHRSLLEGDEIQIGVVSDTHLSSNEAALPELNLAYDTFAERGITEVLHAGDFTAGVGIFRTQAAEIQRHTFETQVDHLVDTYPSRPGIVTRGISGNHDIEGDFGKVGANPVVALANRRPDIEFLGDYSAWVELPNGAWLHLLHGKGGMSYAYSYKAQKLADSYPSGRKPAILIPGHWHVSGHIEQRGVQVLWPGCFEWKSKFMERLGLSPSVGFWILRLTLGEDGSLVKFAPEWNRFWEGRTVAA